MIGQFYKTDNQFIRLYQSLGLWQSLCYNLFFFYRCYGSCESCESCGSY